jgi:hypothetical protein
MPPGAKSRAGVSAHWLAEARLARLTPDVRGRAQKPPLELIYPQEVSAIIAVASSVRVGCGQDRPVSGCWVTAAYVRLWHLADKFLLCHDVGFRPKADIQNASRNPCYRDASNPIQASTPAITQATQLAHNGIEVVAPTVIGRPLTALISCNAATTAKISAARRQ